MVFSSRSNTYKRHWNKSMIIICLAYIREHVIYFKIIQHRIFAHFSIINIIHNIWYWTIDYLTLYIRIFCKCSLSFPPQHNPPSLTYSLNTLLKMRWACVINFQRENYQKFYSWFSLSVTLELALFFERIKVESLVNLCNMTTITQWPLHE
jgi:hypothetical protein